jgi:hypothetical protein
VVPFQDAGNGDLSALGDLWRGRVEQGLASRGVALVMRQDMVAVIDDLHAFAAPGAEDALWRRAGAGVVVTGRYFLQPQRRRAELHVKAVRSADGMLLGAVRHQADLPANWLPLAAQVRGNARHPHHERVTGAPALAAHLDRSCGLRGSWAIQPVEEGRLRLAERRRDDAVHAQPGAVARAHGRGIVAGRCALAGGGGYQ